MKILKICDVFFVACLAATVAVGAVSCGSAAATTPVTSPGGSGAVVNSDCIITAEIKAVRAQTTGFPWEVDILVKTSQNVGDLPNPTKDSVGSVITVKTNENMALYKTGDIITGRVKYTGDVPKPGITLELYDVKIQ